MRHLFITSLIALAGCDTSAATDGGGGTPDLGFAPDLSSGGGGDMAMNGGADLSGGLESVTFNYKPAWQGATSVGVIGAFGTGDDWDKAKPYLTLTDDGSGNYTGKAMLPSGQTFPYLYVVSGDADGPKALMRYSVDPLLSDYVQCPAGSPTAGNDPNPCSLLTVPQKAPAQTFHLQGQVNYDGAAKSGYLVILERDEQKSHHFFANRVDSDGNGGFDFVVAPGAYRVQVQHPTLLTESDAQRVPGQLQAVRRAISTAVMVSSTVSIAPPAEVAYHDYDKMAPQAVTDGGLPAPTDGGPTQLIYTIVPGSTTARACIFGGPKNIGDPWWTSKTGTATSASFDGTFNTAKAMTPDVVAGTPYFWGTEEFSPRVDGGVTWTNESMVFPIVWQ